MRIFWVAVATSSVPCSETGVCMTQENSLTFATSTKVPTTSINTVLTELILCGKTKNGNAMMDIKLISKKEFNKTDD